MTDPAVVVRRARTRRRRPHPAHRGDARSRARTRSPSTCRAARAARSPGAGASGSRSRRSTTRTSGRACSSSRRCATAPTSPRAGDLAFDGRWRVTVFIGRLTGTAEVRFVVNTTEPRQDVERRPDAANVHRAARRCGRSAGARLRTRPQTLHVTGSTPTAARRRCAARSITTAGRRPDDPRDACAACRSRGSRRRAAAARRLDRRRGRTTPEARACARCSHGGAAREALGRDEARRGSTDARGRSSGVGRAQRGERRGAALADRQPGRAPARASRRATSASSTVTVPCDAVAQRRPRGGRDLGAVEAGHRRARRRDRRRLARRRATRSGTRR